MKTVTSHASERKARGITSPLRYVAGLRSEIRVAFPSLVRNPRGYQRGIDAGSGDRRLHPRYIEIRRKGNCKNATHYLMTSGFHWEQRG